MISSLTTPTASADNPLIYKKITQLQDLCRVQRHRDSYFFSLLILCSNYPQKSSLLVMSWAKVRLNFLAQKLFDKKCGPSTRPVRLCALCGRVLCVTRGKYILIIVNRFNIKFIYSFECIRIFWCILTCSNPFDDEILTNVMHLNAIDKTFMAISNMLSFMHYFVKCVLFLYRKDIVCQSDLIRVLIKHCSL